jgi:dihydroorotate dehydrogenase
MEAAHANLAPHRAGSGIVGVNIGKNKDTEDAASDYTTLIRRFADVADYFTINISSPNTQGLRALQDRDALMSLMKAIIAERDAQKRRVPVLVKIAPDLDEQAITDIASVTLMLDCDGVIISNTTTARPDSLRSHHKAETGGLSGAPVFAKSNEVLASFYRITQGRIPLIGVGGIASAEDAITKIRLGASLVQLYSALVYQGFGLVREINEGIAAHLKSQNMSNITQLIGSDVK